MTQFQGFATKEEAKKFQRKNGGMLTFEERTPKTQKLTGRGRDYMFAVNLGGLDKEKYQYCVQWNV